MRNRVFSLPPCLLNSANASIKVSTPYLGIKVFTVPITTPLLAGSGSDERGENIAVSTPKGTTVIGGKPGPSARVRTAIASLVETSRSARRRLRRSHQRCTGLFPGKS